MRDCERGVKCGLASSVPRPRRAEEAANGMSAEDAFGFHAEGEFSSRHALPFNGCADVLLEIVIGVDGGHMLASIARD